jgi:hypothetical protein
LHASGGENLVVSNIFCIFVVYLESLSSTKKEKLHTKQKTSTPLKRKPSPPPLKKKKTGVALL